MTPQQLTYLVFGIVLIISIALDLGVFSKKGAVMSMRKALYQSIFWLALGVSFFVFVWWVDGEKLALEYLSAYFMEKGLSIDNIFVFILIFSYYRIPPAQIPRVLMIGILLAIAFRIVFITAGVALVSQFSWILYVFGVFLVYTGIKIYTQKNDDSFDPESSRVYKLVRRFFRLAPDDASGKFSIMRNGKKFYTNMFVVVILLATTDIVFAVDSIPAVFAISQEPMVIYTSNIFAVLGLRALFFLLQGAFGKFEYLQQGIAIVLVFIGLKMLVVMIGIHVPVYISLMVILISLTTSVAYSINMNRKKGRVLP